MIETNGVPENSNNVITSRKLREANGVAGFGRVFECVVHIIYGDITQDTFQECVVHIIYSAISVASVSVRLFFRSRRVFTVFTD